MNVPPEIEWLERKWGLPPEAVPRVLELMRAESEGSTACALTGDLPDFGRAASYGGEHDASAGPLPLVVLRDGRAAYLQSRSLYEAERDVAGKLLQLASGVAGAESPKMALLFPDPGGLDLQAAAARTAMSRRLAMITGGPGTGKTHTLARILALFLDAGIPAAEIRLAAPTGKAADRMKRAVSDSLDGLPEEFASALEPLRKVAGSCGTVHALLGYNPSAGGCRFHSRQHLPASVLIVDECSMIDLFLWRALLGAIGPGTRLVLLGDPNQLESVGKGNVFGELVLAAGSVPALAACHVHLTLARRFRDCPGILGLSRAIADGDADAAVSILQASRGTVPEGGLSWIEVPEGRLDCKDFPAPILEALSLVSAAATPDEALAALGRICILTAQREFFVGARAVSEKIDAHFAARGGRNQPVIINRNDPDTGLRNGTVGVIHTSSDGSRSAWFPGVAAGLQEFALAQLPDFSPAWAITIHRSQGSEYDEVLVILPRRESPLATRELLYTAITRARRAVFVAGDADSVAGAIRTPSRRISLLGNHFH